MTNEVSASKIKKGMSFTIGGDIGVFVKGDKVTVQNIKRNKNELELHITSGDKNDSFFVDINDELVEFDDLSEDARRMQKLAGVINEEDEEEEEESTDLGDIPSGGDIPEPTSEPELAPEPELEPEIPSEEEPLPDPETTPEEPTDNPPEPISSVQAAEMILATKGKFFTVTFTKKTDGSTRVMNARLGVTKYLRGGELRYDPVAKGMIPVYDIKNQGYRMLTINRISALSIGANNYTVTSLHEIKINHTYSRVDPQVFVPLVLDIMDDFCNYADRDEATISRIVFDDEDRAYHFYCEVYLDDNMDASDYKDTYPEIFRYIMTDHDDDDDPTYIVYDMGIVEQNEDGESFIWIKIK